MSKICVLTLVRPYEQPFPFTLNDVLRSTMVKDMFTLYEVRAHV